LNLLITSGSGGCIVFFSPTVFSAAALAATIGFLSSLVRGGTGAKVRFLLSVFSYALLGFSLWILSNVGKPSGNEPQTIGDSRTVVSAQATYASMNGGFYEGRFECLSDPKLCVPEYPTERGAPIFLGPDVTRLGTKAGYLRSFYPGPPVEEPGPDVLSASSVQTYAYLSIPASPLTGQRSFCADSTSLICYTPKGKVPLAKHGLCGECEPLE
jgi:hypothetical protein